MPGSKDEEAGSTETKKSCIAEDLDKKELHCWGLLSLTNCRKPNAPEGVPGKGLRRQLCRAHVRGEAASRFTAAFGYNWKFALLTFRGVRDRASGGPRSCLDGALLASWSEAHVTAARVSSHFRVTGTALRVRKVTKFGPIKTPRTKEPPPTIGQRPERNHVFVTCKALSSLSVDLGQTGAPSRLT